MSEDATLGALSAGGADVPDTVVRHLAQLQDGDAEPPEIGRRWLRRWRPLWPQGEAASVDLARLVSQALRALASTEARQETAREPSFRSELGGALTRFFRSHVASPVALVSHVGLALIDIERLRGGLVRRSLFGAEEERIAA